jgi:hypothetical protein
MLARLAVLLTPSRPLHPWTFHSPYTLPPSVGRKSFACLPAVAGHSYENCRGHIFQTKRFSLSLLCANYPLSFDNVPNSFALRKNSTLFFSSKSKLFCENTRGVGVTSLKRYVFQSKGPSLLATLFILCFQPLTNCKFCNTFLLIFMQIGGGVYPLPPSGVSVRAASEW